MIPFPIISKRNKVAAYLMNIQCSNTCSFILDGTNIYGTGRNSQGELGNGSLNVVSPTFKLLRTDALRMYMNCSSAAAWYISTDNKLYFAGSNLSWKYTASASGGDLNSLLWTDVSTLITSKGLRVQDIQSIYTWNTLKTNILMNNGDLYCVGKNNTTTVSSFGDGTNTDSLVLVFIRSGIAMTSGNFYLGTDKTLYGTGMNGQYQYGNNGTVSSTGLVQIDTGVDYICTGYSTKYYLKGSLLYASGSTLGSQYGNEFGNGDVTNPSVLRVNTLLRSDVKEVYNNVGNIGSVIRLVNGDVYVSGYNTYGQLGTGAATALFSFTKIVLPSGINSSICIMGLNTFYSTGKTLYTSGSMSAGLNNAVVSTTNVVRVLTLVPLPI